MMRFRTIQHSIELNIEDVNEIGHENEMEARIINQFTDLGSGNLVKFLECFAANDAWKLKWIGSRLLELLVDVVRHELKLKSIMLRGVQETGIRIMILVVKYARNIESVDFTKIAESNVGLCECENAVAECIEENKLI